jgi:hypothetical protein
VKRRISGIQLVRDLLHETLIGNSRRGNRGRRAHQPDCRGFVGNDRREKFVNPIACHEKTIDHEGHEGTKTNS